MLLYQAQVAGESVKLANTTGKFVALHALLDGQVVSAFGNSGKQGRVLRVFDGTSIVRKQFSLTSMPLIATDSTVVLKLSELVVLANCFANVWEALPKKLTAENATVENLNLPLDSDEAQDLLRSLHRSVQAINQTVNAARTDLNTRLRSLKLKAKRSPKPTECFHELCEAFTSSVEVFDSVPTLRRFGDANQRTEKAPTRACDLLRAWVASQSDLSSWLPGLAYKSYELKPLNIYKLKWIVSDAGSDSDSRTESIDLLLTYHGAPVMTEVKMANDSNLSSAIVQLLYYAAMMVSRNQRHRFVDTYHTSAEKPWLGFVLEKRSEKKQSKFKEDLASSLAFLQATETSRALGEHLRGTIVLLIASENGGYTTQSKWVTEFKPS